MSMPHSVAVEQIAKAAVACEVAAPACPAELLFSQCAIESGWLAHSPGNNCFGLKAHPGIGNGRQLLHTTEWFTPEQVQEFLRGDASRTAIPQAQHGIVRGRTLYIVQDWFATFASLADCFLERAKMFSKPPYAVAAQQYEQNRDFPALVRSIAHFYATAEDYAAEVLRIAGMTDVQAALAAARVM